MSSKAFKMLPSTRRAIIRAWSAINIQEVVKEAVSRRLQLSRKTHKVGREDGEASLGTALDTNDNSTTRTDQIAEQETLASALPSTAPRSEIIEEVLRVINPGLGFHLYIQAQVMCCAKDLWLAHERIHTIQAVEQTRVDRIIEVDLYRNAFAKSNFEIELLREGLSRGDWPPRARRMLLLAMAHDDIHLTRKLARVVEKVTVGTDVNYFFGIEEVIRENLYRHEKNIELDAELRTISCKRRFEEDWLQAVQLNILDAVDDDSSAETKYYAIWAISSIIEAAIHEKTPPKVMQWIQLACAVNDLLHSLLWIWNMMTEAGIDHLLQEESTRRKNCLDAFEVKMAALYKMLRSRWRSFTEDFEIVAVLMLAFSARGSTMSFDGYVVLLEEAFERVIQHGTPEWTNRNGEDTITCTIRHHIETSLLVLLNAQSNMGTRQNAYRALIMIAMMIVEYRQDHPGLLAFLTANVDNMVTDALFMALGLLSETSAARKVFRKNTQCILATRALSDPEFLRGSLPGLRSVMARFKNILECAESDREDDRWEMI